MNRELDRDVARWMAAIAPYRHSSPVPNPSSSVLLVIDMQNFFAGIGARIIERTRRLIDGCRELGVPVVFTQHGHADPSEDAGMLGGWWSSHVIEGTVDHQIIDALGATPEDTVIAKRRYSAFYRTELGAELERLGVTDIAVAGVMTNLCVETTVRDAFVRDYRVRVLADATATATDPMHVASLLNMAFGFAHVQTVAEWLASLRRALSAS